MRLNEQKLVNHFLNKPIGIVNVRTGAEKVYEAKARTASGIGDIAFEFAKQTQIKQGAEYAKEVLVEDENGMRGYQEVPKHLGSYGREEANRIYQKRYIDALQKDTRNFAKQLREVEKDPVRYEEIFNDYVKQTLTSIDADGGADVASVVAPTLYDTGKLHVNDMQVKALAAKEEQSKADYLSVYNMRRADMAGLSGQDLEDAKNSLLEDINESGPVYGFTATKMNEMINDVRDEYALSVFNTESVNQNSVLLLALQDRNNWDSIAASGRFEKTINTLRGFDSTRLSEFNTRISAIYNDRNALEKRNKTVSNIQEGMRLGTLINDKDTRDGIGLALRYDSPFDALSPSLEVANLENNIGIPSSQLMSLATSADVGFVNPQDIVPFASRLAQIDAVQKAKGRGLIEFFGDGMGQKMEGLLALTKSIGRMGEDELVRAYQQRNERNSQENIEVAARNADYTVTDKTSLNDIAKYYVNENLSDLPPVAREEAVRQVGYMLTFDTPGNVAGAVKDFAVSAYKPSGFYERYSENNSYSKYINAPETYLNTDELRVLRSHMQTVGKPSDANRFLEPIQSSAIGATWLMYELDSRGGKNYIMDGDGRPVALYSQNYKKSYEAQRAARFTELQIMRNQALTPEARDALESEFRGVR